MAKDNTSHGFLGTTEVNGLDLYIGCISHNNGNGAGSGSGIDAFENAVIINCVIDGNDGDGVNVDEEPAIIIGSRITNNTGYGINQGASSRTVYGWNFFNNNKELCDKSASS